MSVFRVEKNKGYTVMSNHHLRNHALSLKAKGLLSQMLSLPDDWDYTLQGLAQINKESIDAIREAVRELERAGYIKRSRERDERGCLRGTVYTIYEQPHAQPTPEEPAQEKSALDNPTLEKPMVVCGDKVYPSEYGTSYFATKLEKDIIFGSIFTAAPELIVSTNTAFKKIQQSTALAGVQKTSPNTQVGNIVNGLKQAGVWDVEGLEALAQSKGNDGAAAVAKIASFILQRFSQGTQIKLDALWQELQDAPYGYYNCMACGYILGFLLRYYVNSEFSWNKGDNNPWPLTDQTLATMITSLCKEEVINNYLSPGSEVWQKFKPYA